ncbi:MAG: hydrogenase maturation protease [Chloroflexi bacterium]|nr:hydrogenase maturation protease [Chloroflexota bacterium]
MQPTLILGLGNPLQADDGIGCRVAQELATRALPDVEVMDGGTPGVGLINLLQGRARAIIVDAAEMQLLPGEVRVFDPRQVHLDRAREQFSLHHCGVADALALADALKLTLPEITLVGVQPARVEWGAQLTPRVQAALPRVIETVIQQLDAVP